MASPAGPAETRAYIVERLVGDTGEPDRILATARALAERALIPLRDSLAASLGSVVGVEILGVELARMSTARPSDPATHGLAIATSPSSSDALVVVIDPQAAAIAVSTLFGADPEIAITPISRPLSPTEIVVARLVMDALASAINGSGERAFGFSLPLSEVLTGETLRKHVIRDGPAVRIDFALAGTGGVGRLSALMPQRVLVKHRSDTTHSSGDVGWTERFGEEIMRSAVTLEATMPLTKISLGDVAYLQVGQVIQFQDNAQSEAKLSSRGKALFVCEFGKLGQSYTVRIKHAFDARQELIDGLMSG
jgi:flagellar motor switch protein FliM